MSDKLEKRQMLVGDLMTREVVTAFEEENLATIEEGMERFAFRHLPVVDGKKLVGLLTHRDLLRVGASPLVPGEKVRTQTLLEHTFVRDVMRTKLVTVQEDELLVTAAETMRDRKLGCLPVVNDEFELVGIVTASDLLDLAIRFLGGE